MDPTSASRRGHFAYGESGVPASRVGSGPPVGARARGTTKAWTSLSSPPSLRLVARNNPTAARLPCFPLAFALDAADRPIFSPTRDVAAAAEEEEAETATDSGRRRG
jgi:hypothetical protein